MKTLWKITLTANGAMLINKKRENDVISIRSDFCSLSKNDSLIFTDTKDAEVILMVREGCWAMVEREKFVVYKGEEKEIYEDGESENAANYNAYKELEKDD